MRAALASATAPVTAVLSSLNGEHLFAKEWGVAARRNHRLLAEDAPVVHPAEHHGDPGAASGALLAGLAAIGLTRGAYGPSALVWAASDGPARGAARFERSAT